MSSPEKEEEEAPDQQLSLVLRDSVVKPLAPLIPPQGAEPQRLPKYYSTDMLSLSRTKLQHVPESVLRNSSIKVSLDFTVHLSTSAHLPTPAAAVLYLSIICSSAVSVPSNCSFYHLQYLYLEGNHISSVPGSLFISLPNLQWLDLRHNQIASLPAEIGLHR